ncbi:MULTISPECIES: hypothetical protein [unclassified Serratia (in: enterobacteria)]|uniref:hypothetical protein n=1 Tax=unclassified Serratia (in: enterobacteria) TaxID=2647522 RepID=UPI00068BED48|nr:MULTISPECIES: hypothetical protein [unclassified Serratia (in: enterobacteria)]
MMFSKKSIIRFLLLNIIWIFVIFFMASVMFFIIRSFTWYAIGGDFLFSFMDVKRAFKVAMLVGPVCGMGLWVLYCQRSRS